MPRKPREKHVNAIYHIMCRSMSEILLFRSDSDKDYYLTLLKKYIDKYKCNIYAYCLMDNHLHIHLDPKGFDISKLMHSINTAYVRFYNKKYQRHGPLFQGRFQSRIVDTDRYNLVVSAYIHNNPKDIPHYKDKVEDYKYSSYGIYLGIRKNTLDLINKSFIVGYFMSGNETYIDYNEFVKRYRDFVNEQGHNDTNENPRKDLATEVEYEYIRGRSVILRALPVTEVITFISSSLKIVDKHSLAQKNMKSYMDFRSFCAYTLRVFCGLSYSEICQSIHNITISGCAYLCNRGHKLVNSDNPVYSTLLDEILKDHAFAA